MRVSGHNTVLKGRAIAGTYVVILAWDFIAGQGAKLEGLLGFAIERSELQNGNVVERYWMKGIKRFRDKDRGLAPGTPVSTADHPIQSFQWGDYTAEQDRQYEYRIVPLYGAIKNIQPDDASSLSLEVHTEIEYLLKPAVADDTAKHDVYFNRGVIGSQAFARRFGNAKPKADNPTSPEMKWLSRGLFEALIRFIGLAEDHSFSLRAAVYEFHYQPVANAFAKAIEAGADVKIVYDAESTYKKENEAVIDRAGLRQAGAVIPRTVSEGIRHNKFIVLEKDKVPVAVWTGSTNISDGGIFGHSNVGHIVWDVDVAKAYAGYWERLKDNLTPTKLRRPNRDKSPLPAGKPAADTITPVFSARDEPDKSDSLQWYADRMAEAAEIVCFTVAFNIDKVFQKVLQQENDVFRYVVKDDDLRSDEIITRDRDVLFAAGGYLGEGALANFLEERDNPLNSNDYIHDKFLLIDPLSADPLIVTGSANFSQPSQRTNDENMLVIRGDTRVADIYFGEFMRIFDHHYARYLVKKVTEAGKHDPDAGYLKEKPEEWIKSHFNDSSYKSKRRRYFVG
ncbi:phospholipase D-like domain-containing protein [Rhizobium sp. HT1-10]|uniref:phospholipase D-like domain-containing protein n=1 Tax=Rhizobium sp. HT1-10 TaxID=3111638 RepID=UPI003C184A0A